MSTNPTTALTASERRRGRRRTRSFRRPQLRQSCGRLRTQHVEGGSTHRPCHPQRRLVRCRSPPRIQTESVLEIRHASEPTGLCRGDVPSRVPWTVSSAVCAWDGRIGNALGHSSATCPGCHGSGRRADTSSGFHDVTKTKPSHYHPEVAIPQGPKGPATSEGAQLALEVSASAVLAEDAKRRLLAEIVNHESTHDDAPRPSSKRFASRLARAIGLEELSRERAAESG